MGKIMLNGVDYSAPTSVEDQIKERLTLHSDTKTTIISMRNDNAGCVPLEFVADPLILNSDTTDTALRTEKKIYMKGSNASIYFDSASMGTTKISKDGLESQQLKAYYVEASTFKIINTISSSLRPNSSNTYTLGDSTYRWKQLFANTSVISTSDRNLKKDIKDLNFDDKWIEFFMLLQPKSYVFKDGESGRTHIGFISQDVEEALEACGLTSLDFAGFCKDQKVERKTTEKITHPANDETGEEEWVEEKEIEIESPVFDDNGKPVYIYSLRYEEFIALNTMMIQKLYTQNKDFEERLTKIEKLICNNNQDT